MDDQEREPSSPNTNGTGDTDTKGGAGGTPVPDGAAAPGDGEVAPGGEPPVRPVLTPAQAKRANSTVIGMLIALGATIAVVLPVYFLNPTYTAETYQRDVNVEMAARQAAGDAGYLPAAPDPEGWTSNFARWNAGTSDGVNYWEVGFLTADRGFIQLTQTDQANPTWVSQRLDEAQVSGTRTIDGVEWELLDSPDGDTALTTEFQGQRIILNGEAGLAEFDLLGGATLAEIEDNAAEEATRTPAAAEAP
ncbi:DUF4245 domain-containing protein [Arthrobacter sp. Br18]|uniref:DUF4245 domain-containing protein n=1 Tax=Arthrobacter sp. Br18 TaxID=1312954 RepID=UPI0004B42240|nr:DUF4245 domain-containing protein [Arthrobacter sp. Br18]